MSAFGDQLREEAQEIIDEPMPEPSEPVRIETEGVFDPSLLDSAGYPFPPEEMGDFLDNPMKMVMKVLTNYLDSLKPRSFEPIESEHKVRIFQINDGADLEEIAKVIEDLLNDGYCCHMPTVVNDYVIMDFSRRKEENDAE